MKIYLFRYFFGLLLHYANSSPPITRERQFYDIKTMLLKKYGVKVGQDIQHIKKECYTCAGSGIFKGYWKKEELCWRCSGTGIYDEFWTRLDKYRLGKWYFHVPLYRMPKYSPLSVDRDLKVIEGYIRHKKPKYYLDAECALWLFCFFDFRTFKSYIDKIGYLSAKRTPMVLLANMLYNRRTKDIPF